jgi:hypothetical protein
MGWQYFLLAVLAFVVVLALVRMLYRMLYPSNPASGSAALALNAGPWDRLGDSLGDAQEVRHIKTSKLSQYEIGGHYEHGPVSGTIRNKLPVDPNAPGGPGVLTVVS